MQLPIISRLKKELEALRRELAIDVPKALEEARLHGDLSENAEYEAARARQDFIRARVSQKEAAIRALSIYTVADIPRGVVALGSQVSVENVDTGDVERFRIVLPEEVDAANGCISLSSPMGRGLRNKGPGDEFEVHTPGGKRSYQVIELITIHETVGDDHGNAGDGD
jgi:transcription elongation factor GreA